MPKKRALVTQQGSDLCCFISPELGGFEFYAEPRRIKRVKELLRQFRQDISIQKDKKDRIRIDWEKLRRHPLHTSPIWEAIAALQHIISSRDIIRYRLGREECFQVTFERITIMPMVLGELAVFPYEDTAKAFAHFILPSGAMIEREHLVA